MNFKALKWMIESLVKTYKCPECWAEVNDNNVDVVWAAGTTINIDIECPNCGKHSMIKSEVMSLDLTKANITPEQLVQLQKRLGKLWGNVRAEIVDTAWNKKDLEDMVQEKKSENAIKDEEIIELNNELKNDSLNVSDLFWDEENKLD